MCMWYWRAAPPLNTTTGLSPAPPPLSGLARLSTRNPPAPPSLGAWPTASIHRLYVATQRSALSREHFDCVFLSVNLLLHICLQKISSSIEYISLCSFMTALCSRQAEMRFKNVVFRLAACFVRPPGIDHYMRRALEPQLVLVTAA